MSCRAKFRVSRSHHGPLSEGYGESQKDYMESEAPSAGRGGRMPIAHPCMLEVQIKTLKDKALC